MLLPALTTSLLALVFQNSTSSYSSCSRLAVLLLPVVLYVDGDDVMFECVGQSKVSCLHNVQSRAFQEETDECVMGWIYCLATTLLRVLTLTS